MGTDGQIYCQCLGGFRLFDSAGKEIPFPIAKGAAIIAYLAVFGKDRASRAEVAELLWGDTTTSSASTSFRKCLSNMRAKLPGKKPQFLDIDGDPLSIDRTVFRTDVDALLDPERFLSVLRDKEIDPFDFMVGFEDLGERFNTWLYGVRTRLDTRLSKLLKGAIADTGRSHDDRLFAAETLCAKDPSDEQAARFLIEEAAGRKDLVALLRAYQKLWDALDEDWGEEPSAELQDFVGRTRASLGEMATATQSDAKTPFRKFLTVLAIGAEVKADARGLIKDLVEASREAVDDKGGTILEAGDDGLLAVFGLTGQSADSARDGVEVALELTRSWADQVDRLRFGLDTGYLLVEALGADGQSPRVSGGVIERAKAILAGNLESAITATSATMRGLEEDYLIAKNLEANVVSLKTFRVFGRSEPEHALPGRSMADTFVGRAPFLAALWETWSGALETGSLQIASIQGEAGVGKTRFAKEFLKRLSDTGVRTLRTECNQHHRNAPFEPLLDLLRAAGEQAGFGHTDALHSASSAGQGSRRLGIDDVVRALSDVLAQSAAVILIDDWQWADDATRIALGKFASMAADKPLLLVLASRNVPVDDWLVSNSQQIVLTGLTAREVEERAETLLHRPIDRRLKQQIVAKSGGNPLFLEEVCHAIRTSAFDRNPDHIIADLPANVQALFAGRIEQLEADALEIVFAAAAYGDQIETELISKVASRPVRIDPSHRLFDHDVLVWTTTREAVRFKHGLVRDVAYNMIPDERRKALHLAFAQSLKDDLEQGEEREIAERLAFHYRGGEDVEQASKYAEMSGDKALSLSSLDKAAWHYGNALDLLDRLPKDKASKHRWVSIVLRWAIPTTYAPSYEQLDLLDRADTLAHQIGDEKALGALMFWRGYFAYVLGEKASAIEMLRRARKMSVAADDPRQAVEAQAVEGCALVSVADYDTAEPLLRDAIAIKDRNPGKASHPPVTSVYARANLALLRADKGDFAQARELIDEALSRVKGFEHEVESSILLFSGTINIWRGDWQAALEDAIRSRERSEKVSSPYLMGMSRCIWGYAHWQLNGGKLGLETLTKNARWMKDRGMRMYFSLIGGWLAEALAQTGSYEAAEAACSDALSRAADNEIAGASMACRASATGAIALGQLEFAAQRLEMAEGFARRRGAPHEVAANALVSARLHNAAGDQAKARDCIDAAKALYNELGLDARLVIAGHFEAEMA